MWPGSGRTQRNSALMLHHAKGKPKTCPRALLLCQTQAGNTDGNRLEKQFAAALSEELCCGDHVRHRDAPQRNPDPCDRDMCVGDRSCFTSNCQRCCQIRLTLDVFCIIWTSCFQVTWRLAKSVAHPSGMWVVQKSDKEMRRAT